MAERITREQAHDILMKYMRGERYIQHSYAVEAIMKGLAKRLAPHSLVFIISLEGSFFYRNTEIVDILTEKECKIVAISMITVGKLISSCDEVILCNKTNSNTEGRITLMYTIELIIIYYYINYSHI